VRANNIAAKCEVECRGDKVESDDAYKQCYNTKDPKHSA